MEAQRGRDPAGNRALAGSRRAIDGNDRNLSVSQLWSPLGHDALGICCLRPHPDVEISRRPDPAMGGQGMGTDDQILNAARVEYGQ